MFPILLATAAQCVTASIAPADISKSTQTSKLGPWNYQVTSREPPAWVHCSGARLNMPPSESMFEHLSQEPKYGKEDIEQLVREYPVLLNESGKRNALVSNLVGIATRGDADEPSVISLRAISQNVIVWDDPLQASPVHMCAIPRKDWIKNASLLFYHPQKGLKLVQEMREMALTALRENFLQHQNFMDYYFKEGTTAQEVEQNVIMGFNVPPTEDQLHLQVHAPPFMPDELVQFRKGNKIRRGRFLPVDYVIKCLEFMVENPGVRPATPFHEAENPLTTLDKFFQEQMDLGYEVVFNQMWKNFSRSCNGICKCTSQDFKFREGSGASCRMDRRSMKDIWGTFHTDTEKRFYLKHSETTSVDRFVDWALPPQKAECTNGDIAAHVIDPAAKKRKLPTPSLQTNVVHRSPQSLQDSCAAAVESENPNDIAELLEIILNERNVHARNHLLQSVFNRAVEMNNMWLDKKGILEKLLKYGAKVTPQSIAIAIQNLHYGYTFSRFLIDYARNGSTADSILLKLCQQQSAVEIDFDVIEENISTEHLIAAVCAEKDIQVVRALVNHMKKLQPSGQSDISLIITEDVFHSAVLRYSTDIVHYFITEGAAVPKKSVDMVLEENCWMIATVLFDGAVKATSEMLEYVISKGGVNFETFEVLLNCGAPASPSQMSAMLQDVISEGNREACEFLLERGAPVTAEMLDKAFRLGDEDILELVKGSFQCVKESHLLALPSQNIDAIIRHVWETSVSGGFLREICGSHPEIVHKMILNSTKKVGSLLEVAVMIGDKKSVGLLVDVANKTQYRSNESSPRALVFRYAVIHCQPEIAAEYSDGITTESFTHEGETAFTFVVKNHSSKMCPVKMNKYCKRKRHHHKENYWQEHESAYFFRTFSEATKNKYLEFLNRPNNSGQTPMKLALEMNLRDVVAVLAQINECNGANVPMDCENVDSPTSTRKRALAFDGSIASVLSPLPQGHPGAVNWLNGTNQIHPVQASRKRRRSTLKGVRRLFDPSTGCWGGNADGMLRWFQENVGGDQCKHHYKHKHATSTHYCTGHISIEDATIFDEPPLMDRYRNFHALLKDGMQNGTEFVNQFQPDHFLFKGSLQPLADKLGLDRSCNEMLLFHGSSQEACDSIIKNGFAIDKAKAGGRFGPGAYFTSHLCKALHYAASNKKTEKFVLVARVLAGQPYKTEKNNSELHGLLNSPPRHPDTGKPCHSIYNRWGEVETHEHSEVVVFKPDQVAVMAILKVKADW